MGDVFMLNFDLGKTVSYTMNVAPDGEREKIKLEFRTSYIKREFGTGMKGYTYSFNGRTYRDVASLRVAPLEKICEDVYLTADAYGEKVLRTYTDIPTFDSADREWDSMELEYLFFDGKHIQMVVLRGGYEIASLTFYENLLSADSRMKPVFEILGWPVDGIAWY